MIQITLDNEKQAACESVFLEIMESRLPFYRSEIYGEELEENITDEKERDIKNARRTLWKYPKLYSFLYLVSEKSTYPQDEEEAVKISVYGDRLRQLLVGRHGKMIKGHRRKYLMNIIDRIGRVEEGTSCLLNNIFRYDKFADSVGAKKLLKMLGVTVCPYCNRMFIATIERGDTDNGWNGTRPQFDHYFNKSRYPYLAVNFYNLIPSCNSCNQYKYEHDTYEEPLLYPYDEGLGKEYVFAVYPEKYNLNMFFEDLIGKDENFKLLIEPNPKKIYKSKKIAFSERIELEKRIRTSVKKLHLKELYNTHADYAANIMRSGYLFSEPYIKMLNERFPEMEFSMQDVKKLLYCKDLSEEHWGQNILAKLASDLDAEISKGN